MTAEEIRQRILAVTTANGGHLASSLGAVEIAMALSEVFEPAHDRIVWDVGHQAYAWKIVTGRNESFDTLRKLDGIAPFPLPTESKADAAVSGHAGSALSVAVGLAAARDRQRTNENVVAVIGDASMANGHSFEALNNLDGATRKLIVILNDNEMSISRPVGALAKLFGRLLTGVKYNRTKAAAENLGHRLRLTPLRGIYHRLESRLKGLFLGNRYFEQFGMRYIGPVDGHDLKALRDAFIVAREDKRSVLVHVITKKGKGYAPAEADPTTYHGIPAGGVATSGTAKSWSDVFGTLLCEQARKDGRIVALTAGMKDGTGLNGFAEEFPERFFDVGIAEGHMLGFAAGLAAGGMRPVVAVYSTFLQRAVDQLIHDIAISSLPVVICVDRAGLVGADGVTHQGMFDLAILRNIPNLTICEPCSEEDFREMMSAALKRNSPTVIRYPRGKLSTKVAVQAGEGLARQLVNPEASVQLWVAGDRVDKALAVASATGCGVVLSRYLKPFDAELLKSQRDAGKMIVSWENGAALGGFGEMIGAARRIGWPDQFIPHGSVDALERKYAQDVDSVTAIVSNLQHERS